MKLWVIKAVTQKVISFLPFSHSINRFFQRYVSKGLILTEQLFEDKLNHCREHFDHFKKFGEQQELRVLEIGTGWYPVVPIGMYLYGAESIMSVDIEGLLKRNNVWHTIAMFIQWADKGILARSFGEYDKERLEYLRQMKHDDLTVILDELKIDYVVGDIMKNNSDFKASLIISNNTFEHINPNKLVGILNEFRRRAIPGAIMSHAIDMSDHFSHLDKSISEYNFLRFSDNAWKWVDNSIQPQNRMRVNEFKAVYDDVGLPIIHETRIEGNRSAMNSIKLDGRFSKYDPEDVAVIHCTLVSKIQ
ncbi:MAG: hypothetical protein IH946_04690 [Bacteroidetes bacterium]|nr:hypothetical protein [Bacteroidota bacterium]